MGKTYEALQWAEKEYQVNRRETSIKSLPAEHTKPPKRVWTRPSHLSVLRSSSTMARTKSLGVGAGVGAGVGSDGVMEGFV